MNAPAPITFFCVHCGTKLLVPFELAGQSGPCPQCAEVITSPLVSSARQVPVPAPVASAGLPPAPVQTSPPAWHQDFGSPPMAGLPSAPAPGGYPVPSNDPGIYGGIAQDILPRQRTAPSGRRRQAPARGDFPGDVDPGRFDEPAPSRPFPVALVSLLVVVLCGSGYLSWRMGFWGPVEAAALAGNPSAVAEPPSTIAKIDPLPVLPASGNPVASSGAGPGIEPRTKVPLPGREPAGPSREPAVPAPTEPIAGTIPPPGPEPLVSLGAEPIRKEENPPPISEPRLAVAPPVPVRGSAARPSLSSATAPSLVPEAPPAASGPASVSKAGENAPLDQARAVIRDFLEAESWRNRVGLVELDGDPAAVLSAYYQRNPDIPVKNYRLDFFHTEESASAGVTAHIFFLTFANETDGFPVMVLERNGRMRIDWGLYVEFRQRVFQKFVEGMPAESARLRVVVQRVTYSEADRDEIPGLDQFLCYKVDPPYPGMTRFAFVDKEKPIGKQLAREISWESDPLAAEVELKWEAFPGGKRYLTIGQLVSPSWVRVASTKVAQP